MKKKYTADEILEMAVGKREKDLNADYNGDKEITVQDARYADRVSSGLEKAAYIPDAQTDALSENVLNEIMNNAVDTTDINSSELYARYKKMYENGAAKAAENTYGLALSHSGGYGNSYAASAAQSAYEQYMNGLYEQYPSLLKQGQDNLFKTYELLKDREQEDYNRYKDELNYQTQEKENNLNFALKAAQNGDYSYLDKLGVDTTQMQYEQLLKTATQLAEYGDYSGLEALGVNLDELKKNNRLSLALNLAKYGDYSILGEYTSYPWNLSK